MVWLAAVYFLKSGSQAHWVYEKIRTPRSFYLTVRNMLNFSLGIPRIAGWITMNIETAVNCNLSCKYCMEAIRKQGTIARPALMEWELFTRIIDEAPETIETVTFGGIGEPLLHPDIVEMIAYASKSGRRVCMFSNGTLLTGELLTRLAESPLDTLNVSLEPDSESARYYRGIDYEEIAANIRAFAAVKRKGVALNVALVLNEAYEEKIDTFRQEWDRIIDNIKISPKIEFCSIETNATPYICSELWRGNMDVKTNGNVSVCCVDVLEELVIGNVKTTPLRSLIDSEVFKDLLERMITGDTPVRCRKCTASCLSGKQVLRSSRKTIK